MCSAWNHAWHKTDAWSRIVDRLNARRWVWRGRQGKDNLWQAKKVDFYPKGMAELYKWSDLMIFGSQKIHSGSTVGMDQNGANLELERTVKKLCILPEGKCWLVAPRRSQGGMDKRVTIGESSRTLIGLFVILLCKHRNNKTSFYLCSPVQLAKYFHREI